MECLRSLVSGECKDKEIPDGNKGREEGGRDWGASEAREERGDKRTPG